MARKGWCPGRHGRWFFIGNSAAIALLAAAAMAFGRVSPLRAQAGPKRAVPVPPLVALAIHDLAFGTVLPGITSSVSIRNPHDAGLFEVDGPAGASVRVEFVLPAALLSSGGAMLPVAFGPGDGFADFSHGYPPRGTVFDPHAPVIGALGASGRLFVRMGGTVLPARSQAGGAYAATITMTVFDLGS